jgi:hypothetical protein
VMACWRIIKMGLRLIMKVLVIVVMVPRRF